MKAWLKYGIVFTIIDAILMMLVIFLSSSQLESEIFGLMFLGIPLSWVYISITGISYRSELIMFGIVGLINWFIIGSLIGLLVGWIIGKVKKK